MPAPRGARRLGRTGYESTPASWKCPWPWESAAGCSARFSSSSSFLFGGAGAEAFHWLCSTKTAPSLLVDFKGHNSQTPLSNWLVQQSQSCSEARALCCDQGSSTKRAWQREKERTTKGAHTYSSRELRIRVPTFSVVQNSRGTLPQERGETGLLAGGPRYCVPNSQSGLRRGSLFKPQFISG